MSVYRYLKNYSTNTIETDIFIDVEEPKSGLQRASIQRQLKKSLDRRNNLEHCLTCGRCAPRFEGNDDLIAVIKNTVEELQNRRVGGNKSDVSNS